MSGVLDSIVIERALPHSPSKVWRALTQPWLVAEWLMPGEIRAEAGHHFQFRMPPMPQWDGVVDCEVLAAEPERLLRYTWNSGADPSQGLRTVITFTLTPTDDGVLLRMEHSGFREHEMQNYHGARFGWNRNLDRLAEVVAAQG